MSDGARMRRPTKAIVLGLGLLLLVLAVGGVLGWHAAGPPDLSPWDDAIERAAHQSNVDVALLKAMVAVESGGNARARSVKGACGLLQLVPATAAEEARRLGLDVKDPEYLYDPEINLRLGAAYLSRLLARYDDAEAFALAAYNAGPTAVNRWRNRAPDASPLDVVLREGYEETRRYVVKVLRWRDHYRE